MFSLCFFCWVGHKNGFLLVSAGTGWFSNTPTQLIYKKMLHIRRPSPTNWYLMPGKTGVDKPVRVSCHVGYWLFCRDVKHRSSPVLKNCHSTHQTSEIKAITIYYFEFYFVIKFRGINSCNQVFVINVFTSEDLNEFHHPIICNIFFKFNHSGGFSFMNILFNAMSKDSIWFKARLWLLHSKTFNLFLFLFCGWLPGMFQISAIHHKPKYIWSSEHALMAVHSPSGFFL